MFVWGVLGAGVVGFVFFLRWLLKWRDPSWDTEEGQSKAFLWSTRSGSGGFGA